MTKVLYTVAMTLGLAVAGAWGADPGGGGVTVSSMMDSDVWGVYESIDYEARCEGCGGDHNVHFVDGRMEESSSVGNVALASLTLSYTDVFTVRATCAADLNDDGDYNDEGDFNHGGDSRTVTVVEVSSLTVDGATKVGDAYYAGLDEWGYATLIADLSPTVRASELRSGFMWWVYADGYGFEGDTQLEQIVYLDEAQKVEVSVQAGDGAMAPTKEATLYIVEAQLDGPGGDLPSEGTVGIDVKQGDYVALTASVAPTSVPSDVTVCFTWADGLSVYEDADQMFEVTAGGEYTVAGMPDTIYVFNDDGVTGTVTLHVYAGGVELHSDAVLINKPASTIKVKPFEAPDTSYGGSATIGVGGYATTVHKASVRITSTPNADVTVTLAGAEGYQDDPKPAKLVAGEVTLEGNGSATFHTDNQGCITGVLYSSNVSKTCTITVDGASANVTFEWDNPELEPTDWDYEEYFWEEEPSAVAVTLAQRGIPLDRHTMKFFVSRVTGVRWNPATGKYDEFERDIDHHASEMDYYARFTDDQDRRGDGIVTDDAVDGTYAAYLIVSDRSNDGVYTDVVEFWVMDTACYSQ